MNMKLIAIGIVIILIIVGVVVAASGGEQPPTSTQQEITVYIENVETTWNDTVPQQYIWGSIAPLHNYDRNFTVHNNGNQTLTLNMFTTEPHGSTQSYSANGTILYPSTSNYGTFTLTTESTMTAGDYTWRLVASNGTAPITSPTPNPSATPTPTAAPTYTLTLDVDTKAAFKNVTFTNDAGDKITLTPNTDLPKTFTFTQADSLILTANMNPGYSFNVWEFNDGTFKDGTTINIQAPDTNHALIITAKSIVNP
jgi:hypothetical protein